MGKVSIDVAKESTLLGIHSKIEEGAGIWCNPKYTEKNTLGSTVMLGTITNGGVYGSTVFNMNNNLYIIYDGSNTIDAYNGLTTSWVTVAHLPFVIDVHETSLIVFNGELHLLGGSGAHYRTHYKWDGETWSVASELPYDFSNGKVVEYQNKLHILGGGTANFGSTYGTGRVSNHYSWDGETWKNESDLPYPAWGITPFVQSGKLHIIGGGIVNNTNYNKSHYVWDGISWSKQSDLSFTVFNASIAKLSDTQIYIVGGMDKSGGSKQSTVKLYNGTSWSNVTSLPDDAYNNSSAAATINSDREVVVVGLRMFKLSSGSWYGYQATPVNIEKGDVVLYRNEVHLFYQKSHYKWTKAGWEKVSVIPYNFVGGSAVVFNDKIHLIGSASSGVEDYHYSWSPEDEWRLLSNLPGKFSQGSAVVLKNELHIIGGIYLNDTAYNHYKLVDSRWVVVGHTLHDVVGTRCTVAYGNYIYAATQEADNNGTISKCRIDVFDGTGWLNIGSIETNVSATNYRYLVVYQNRLHLFTTNGTTINHRVITGTKGSMGNVVTYGNISFSGTPAILTYKGRIFVFSKPANNKGSICYVDYAPVDTPTLEIYIPKEHQLICNKKDFLPIIGEVEETDVGYKALTTRKYTFAMFNDVFSIS